MDRFVFACSIWILLAGTIVADDSPASTFKAEMAHWKTLNATLAQTKKDYSAALPTERPKIREKYDQQLEKVKAQFDVLRTAAMAAYKAAPNQDPQLTDTLLGILANRVRSDAFRSAAEISDLLLENQCDAPTLYKYAGVVAFFRDDFAQAENLLTKAIEAKVSDQISNQLPPVSAFLDDAKVAQELWQAEVAIRQAEAEKDDLPRVKLELKQGDVILELYENEAPETVGNFINLVKDKFYDGLGFHRVLSGFMAQTGCPVGDGSGGPGYNIYCECDQANHRKHFSGTLSMAKQAAKNTGGSQFFITFRRTSHLDGLHTVFGRVVEGADLLEKIQRRNPNGISPPEPDRIIKATVIRDRGHDYVPNKVKEEGSQAN